MKGFMACLNCASSNQPELSIADDLSACRFFPGDQLSSLIGNELLKRKAWSCKAQPGTGLSGWFDRNRSGDRMKHESIRRVIDTSTQEEIMGAGNRCYCRGDA